MGENRRELSRSAIRVQEALDTFGLAFEVVELPASTRSAAEAAAAVGCEVGQIAKSLIFRIIDKDYPLLIIASGSNQVDSAVIEDHLGDAIELANAEFVRAHTGFAIGGVPPVGHSQRLKTLIDEDLLRHNMIWAAAGTPRAVFQLTPTALVEITGGDVLNIC